MARRCEHCVFWCDTVFKGETESGWGVWWGECAAGVDRGRGHHSLMFACEEFEQRPPCGHIDKGNACRAGACDYRMPAWVADPGRAPSSVRARPRIDPAEVHPW